MCSADHVDFGTDRMAERELKEWTMKPIDIIPIVIGLACIVLGHFFPDLKETLLIVGGALGGWGGLSRPSSMLEGRKVPPAVGAVLLFVGALLLPTTARADANDPATGGCLTSNDDGTCKASFQLSVALPVAVVDLKTGGFQGGANALTLGPCYGVTYQPDRWYASGVDLCASASVGTSTPNVYRGALMLHFAKLGSAGIGTQGQQFDGRLVWHALLLFAPRVPVQ
jgi:hypothetical protein